MAAGPFRWFDAALKKIADGTIDLTTDDFYAVLVGSAQSLDETFVGASTDAHYADLTAELATANGYTNGGLLLTGVNLARTSNVVEWSSDVIEWILTNTITYKYLVIFCDNVNNDLLCFFDANTASGAATSSPTAGTLTVTPNASGIVGWERV